MSNGFIGLAAIAAPLPPTLAPGGVEARKANACDDRVRAATESAGRFMTAMAGNLPGYEEASRALYAHDGAEFERRIGAWPPDIRDHTRRLAEGAFAVSPRG